MKIVKYIPPLLTPNSISRMRIYLETQAEGVNTVTSHYTDIVVYIHVHYVHNRCNAIFAIPPWRP